MEAFIRLNIIVLSICAASLSWAGSESSGGGGVFVKTYWEGTVGDSRDPNVELLDIWEGRILHGYEYTRGDGIEIDGILERALARLNEFDPEITVHGDFQNPKYLSLTPVPEGAELSPPTDTNHPFKKPLSEFRGLGYWEDLPEVLWYVPDLYNYMYPLDKAAFLLHESIYKYYRERFGYEKSIWSRKIVAKILSNSPIKAADAGVVNEAVVCKPVHEQYGQSGPTFYITQKEDKIELQVVNVNGFRPIEPMVKTLSYQMEPMAYAILKSALYGENVVEGHTEIVVKTNVEAIKIELNANNVTSGLYFFIADAYGHYSHGPQNKHICSKQ